MYNRIVTCARGTLVDDTLLLHKASMTMAMPLIMKGVIMVVATSDVPTFNDY
jgi:hypothetical protein